MSTEDQIKDLFVADAAAAPVAGGLLDSTMRRVRRRRRQQAAWVTAGCAGLLVAGAVVVPTLGRGMPVVTAAPTGSATTGPVPTGTVPPGLEGQPLGVLRGGAAACAVLPGMTWFTLDAAVVAIEPQQRGAQLLDARPVLAGSSGRADVILHVNRWLTGGDPAEDTVVVRMTAPTPSKAGAGVSYGVGTRLLVSGRTVDVESLRYSGLYGLATNSYECESGAFYYSAPLAAAWADGVLPYQAYYSVYGDAAESKALSQP